MLLGRGFTAHFRAYGRGPENIHEALKAHFAPKHVVGNLVVAAGTRYLDTIDFSLFLEKVVEELNLTIPSPQQVAFW
jgi:hypothetical protein